LHGEFKLRSGQISDHYFDKYRFEAQPSLLRRVAAGLAPMIPGDTDVLAGLELGGVPVATALGLQTGLPLCFVRKQAKPYGTRALAEGADVDGVRLTLVEDIVTTGGQILESTAELRKRGAVVECCLCVIQRNPQASATLAEQGLELRTLFTEADLT
jgi:orotate phosphoribosyltransferase